jgi:hypothetical protein
MGIKGLDCWAVGAASFCARANSPWITGWMASTGQTSRQASQPVHSSSSTRALPLKSVMALTGHTSAHAPHPMQQLESIQTVLIFDILHFLLPSQHHNALEAFATPDHIQ